MILPKVIHWFRQDLRIFDNPALFQAIEEGIVLPIYIIDNVNSGKYSLGAASNVWLHYALASLDISLKGNLSFYQGDPIIILEKLCSLYSIKKIFWNRCYEPWSIERDMEIKKQILAKGLEVTTHNSSLLWEPWHIHKNDGSPYRVFTPFYKKGCLNSNPPRKTLSQPILSQLFKDDQNSIRIEELNLLPENSWYKNMVDHWVISEEGAQDCLNSFLENGISDYKKGRDFPAKRHVSKLSPYLHFGQISPHQIWENIANLEINENTDHFRSELAWREFSYNLLYFNRKLPENNLQIKFDNFPWHNDPIKLKAWQQGQTGIPMVDAGMRELWLTGYMHNRVRMIVGSFLVKNLLIDWRAGERWFWNCLFDADLANNSASWQWVAGSGADAAPYFRIFNPITQGKNFDPEGEYVKKYLPELNMLPLNYLFSPWQAPEDVLKQAGIRLGIDYPKPIIDLEKSREEALQAFYCL